MVCRAEQARLQLWCFIDGEDGDASSSPSLQYGEHMRGYLKTMVDMALHYGCCDGDHEEDSELAFVRSMLRLEVCLDQLGDVVTRGSSRCMVGVLSNGSPGSKPLGLFQLRSQSSWATLTVWRYGDGRVSGLLLECVGR